MMGSGSVFQDKDMITDALSSQKFITDGYNSYSNECEHPQLRDAMMSLLEAEHQIQYDLFNEMKQRGWYQTEAADQAKVQQTKTKFQNQQMG